MQSNLIHRGMPKTASCPGAIAVSILVCGVCQASVADQPADSPFLRSECGRDHVLMFRKGVDTSRLLLCVCLNLCLTSLTVTKHVCLNSCLTMTKHACLNSCLTMIIRYDCLGNHSSPTDTTTTTTDTQYRHRHSEITDSDTDSDTDSHPDSYPDSDLHSDNDNTTSKDE